jgi:hypothetical protein
MFMVTLLAHNLRKRRIPESLVRWVEDFLSGRRTEVKVNDFVLPEAPVSVGIPQGSPISPILYLFYKADLLKAVRASDFVRAQQALWMTSTYLRTVRAQNRIVRNSQRFNARNGQKDTDHKSALTSMS